MDEDMSDVKANFPWIMDGEDMWDMRQQANNDEINQNKQLVWEIGHYLSSA